MCVGGGGGGRGVGRGWKTYRSRSRMASETARLSTKHRSFWAKYASEDRKRKLHGTGVMTTGCKEETIGLTQQKETTKRKTESRGRTTGTK